MPAKNKLFLGNRPSSAFVALSDAQAPFNIISHISLACASWTEGSSQVMTLPMRAIDMKGHASFSYGSLYGHPLWINANILEDFLWPLLLGMDAAALVKRSSVPTAQDKGTEEDKNNVGEPDLTEDWLQQSETPPPLVTDALNLWRSLLFDPSPIGTFLNPSQEHRSELNRVKRTIKVPHKDLCPSLNMHDIKSMMQESFPGVIIGKVSARPGCIIFEVEMLQPTEGVAPDPPTTEEILTALQKNGYLGDEDKACLPVSVYDGIKTDVIALDPTSGLWIKLDNHPAACSPPLASTQRRCLTLPEDGCVCLQLRSEEVMGGVEVVFGGKTLPVSACPPPVGVSGSFIKVALGQSPPGLMSVNVWSSGQPSCLLATHQVLMLPSGYHAAAEELSAVVAEAYRNPDDPRREGVESLLDDLAFLMEDHQGGPSVNVTTSIYLSVVWDILSWAQSSGRMHVHQLVSRMDYLSALLSTPGCTSQLDSCTTRSDQDLLLSSLAHVDHPNTFETSGILNGPLVDSDEVVASSDGVVATSYQEGISSDNVAASSDEVATGTDEVAVGSDAVAADSSELACAFSQLERRWPSLLIVWSFSSVLLWLSFVYTYMGRGEGLGCISVTLMNFPTICIALLFTTAKLAGMHNTAVDSPLYRRLSCLLKSIVTSNQLLWLLGDNIGFFLQSFRMAVNVLFLSGILPPAYPTVAKMGNNIFPMSLVVFIVSILEAYDVRMAALLAVIGQLPLYYLTVARGGSSTHTRCIINAFVLMSSSFSGHVFMAFVKSRKILMEAKGKQILKKHE